MLLFPWQRFWQLLIGVVITCLAGEVVAIPFPGNDSALEWRESRREHALFLPATSAVAQEEGASGMDASVRVDRTVARARSSNEPYYQSESAQTSSDVASAAHQFFRQPYATDGDTVIATAAENAINDKTSVNTQNFWRGNDLSRPVGTHELPEEISRSIEEIQRDVTQLVASVAEVRVDSEGRKSFTLGGIDVFTGPQGSGIGLNQGGVSLALVDYDTKRSTTSEMAMLIDQGGGGGESPSFNPIFRLIQWLKEIFTYPLFWVFIVTLFIGYIATLISKRRSLKRAQEMYSKNQRAAAPAEIDQINQTRFGHRNKRPAASSSTLRSTEPTKTSPGKKLEPSSGSATATSNRVTPAANQAPINPRRTGSIWLKR
ncbi:MAG TPA: hypothetical protein PKN13_06835 [Accumulibacter sp.]|nr:hypothetical protein [Accumulibacter sp.]HMW17813.1 hypothetical protein [Accumulibacter sp.]HMX21752.1 hypothetical protein [Accumulibacter sp.]HNC17753.1 hypothetical protein [Accumulibacter sp.]HND80295.1 hypothetical protein [Accumulibacter sp.]